MSDEMVLKKYNIFKTLREEYDISFKVALERISIPVTSYSRFKKRVNEILKKERKDG